MFNLRDEASPLALLLPIILIRRPKIALFRQEGPWLRIIVYFSLAIVSGHCGTSRHTGTLFLKGKKDEGKRYILKYRIFLFVSKLRNMVRLIPELNEIDTSCEYRIDQRINTDFVEVSKHLARYRFEDNFVGPSKSPKLAARTSKSPAALLIMFKFSTMSFLVEYFIEYFESLTRWKFLLRQDKIVQKKILNVNIFELTAAFAFSIYLEINSRQHRMLFDVIDDDLSLVLPKTSLYNILFVHTVGYFTLDHFQGETSEAVVIDQSKPISAEYHENSKQVVSKSLAKIKNIDEISLTTAHFTKACKCEVQLMSTLTEFREEDSHEREDWSWNRQRSLDIKA
ncbi:hypothetical protein G5I_09841 [Acromyrmex echinatior]|uniref:Uncharacterized protein n=1 Tax=Acromyrmex echinatior TaxID=103372 RepID=F4WV50_ACREC|nr:hypothetical protein G5I_09841 [Acromyrmex echinatior]